MIVLSLTATSTWICVMLHDGFEPVTPSGEDHRHTAKPLTAAMLGAIDILYISAVSRKNTWPPAGIEVRPFADREIKPAAVAHMMAPGGNRSPTLCWQRNQACSRCAHDGPRRASKSDPPVSKGLVDRLVSQWHDGHRWSSNVVPPVSKRVGCCVVVWAVEACCNDLPKRGEWVVSEWVVREWWASGERVVSGWAFERVSTTHKKAS